MDEDSEEAKKIKLLVLAGAFFALGVDIMGKTEFKNALLEMMTCIDDLPEYLTDE